VELTPQVPQRLLGTYIGVLHSSNLCACFSTNYRTVLMGVVVSGTHSKSTTEIAGEVQHSSNLCACSSTNYRTVLTGVVVSGTHSKYTTEIAGDLHRGAAQFKPLCLLLHKLPHCFDGRGG